MPSHPVSRNTCRSENPQEDHAEVGISGVYRGGALTEARRIGKLYVCKCLGKFYRRYGWERMDLYRCPGASFDSYLSRWARVGVEGSFRNAQIERRSVSLITRHKVARCCWNRRARRPLHYRICGVSKHQPNDTAGCIHLEVERVHSSVF